MNRFIKGDKPTGKVLLYSVYKSEGQFDSNKY